ncbi:hypothetical protein [Pseudoalteromonas sp. ASV78]|uniref:hypothetical protein n=1 Tax=Pseudoalteromonas sp. ASV78 TaxID=3397851 RepID=UPI0039FC5EF9
MKNIIVLNCRGKTPPPSIIEYAEQFKNIAMMYTEIYKLNEQRTIDRVFNYYLPLEHRFLVIVGNTTDDEKLRLENTKNVIFVHFSATSSESDADLRPGMIHINADYVDAESLYDWIINNDG